MSRSFRKGRHPGNIARAQQSWSCDHLSPIEHVRAADPAAERLDLAPEPAPTAPVPCALDGALALSVTLEADEVDL